MRCTIHSPGAGAKTVSAIPLAPSSSVPVTLPEAPGGGVLIRLSGFTHRAPVADHINVVFHFQNAADLQMSIPVEIQTGTTATATPVPSYTPPPGPSILFPGTPTPFPSPTETPAEIPVSESPSAGVTVVPPASETP